MPAAFRPERLQPRSLAGLAVLLGLRPTDPDVDVAAAPGQQAGLTGISHDSRAIRPGDLYAALPGANVHGARFS